MSTSKGSMTIRKPTARTPRAPLEPGEVVSSQMRPDLRYEVLERSAHMVLVRSLADGGEGWIARSVLYRVEEA